MPIDHHNTKSANNQVEKHDLNNPEQTLGSVDKIFNVTILKLQRNLERLKRWLGLYQT